MRLTALTLSISIGVSGCSFAFVDGPPANHAQVPFLDCTSSRVVPVLDTIWTTLQILNLGVAASRTDDEWNAQFNGEPPFGRTPALGLYTVFAALGAAGMYYGFTKTGECRDAKQQAMQRAYGQPPPGMGMQPGVGTWPPPAPMGPPGAPMAPMAPPAPPAPPAPAPPAPPAP